MPALIDTHTFLWLTGSPSRLSSAAREYMDNESNELLLSIASGWEIAIKMSLGKLKLGVSLNDLITTIADESAVKLIPVQAAHLITVSQLPFHHKDPFDRILAANCLTQRLPIVSADPIFDLYGVARVW